MIELFRPVVSADQDTLRHGLSQVVEKIVDNRVSVSMEWSLDPVPCVFHFHHQHGLPATIYYQVVLVYGRYRTPLMLFPAMGSVVLFVDNLFNLFKQFGCLAEPRQRRKV